MGFVRTLFGRRRKVRDINSKKPHAESGRGSRRHDTPIQGTAADLIKLAMIRVEASLLDEHPRVTAHSPGPRRAAARGPPKPRPAPSPIS